MLYPFACPSAILDPPRTLKHRTACRAAVIETVKASPVPLSGKEVARELRTRFGKSTVFKVLAELTGCGVLVNHRDKQGYTLAGGN